MFGCSVLFGKKLSQKVAFLDCQSTFILSSESCVFPSLSNTGWSLITHFLTGAYKDFVGSWHLRDFSPPFLLLLIMVKSLFSLMCKKGKILSRIKFLPAL